MNLFRFSIVSIIYLACIIFSSCSKDSKIENPVIRNVILTEVTSNGETITKKYSGVVEEGKSVNAAFMTGGKLLNLNVKEGDKVRKGQLIASLDDTDYQIGVNQLKVQYDQMATEKKRMDEMYARHNIAPNDYEKFVAGFEQLKLHLEMANNKLGYTKLYSPSDGFISYRYMQPGELVDAGTPIYKITDDSKLEVDVDLPLQVYLNKNEIKNAYGEVPGIIGEIPLNIISFTPDADNNQLYHMKLDVPSYYKNNLTTGMNMVVTIEMLNDIKGESLIPSRALFEEKDSTYVWVYNENDSTLSKQPVTVIGQPQGNKSLVKGLKGDERIVTVGVKQLKEGEKVNIVPNPVETK